MGIVPVIVYPTDLSQTSQAALPWVRRMAEALAAEVHCVFVVEEPQPYAALDMAPLAMPDEGEILRSGEQGLARYVESHLAELGGRVRQAVVKGYAAEEIVRYSADQGAEMIIMSTHGYTGVRRVLMGSTTAEVLRKAPCAVLSVRNAED